MAQSTPSHSHLPLLLPPSPPPLSSPFEENLEEKELLSNSSAVQTPPADDLSRGPKPNPPIGDSNFQKSTRQNLTKHRNTIPSTNSTRQNYPGLLGLAALARDKTTSAIASLTQPALRTRHSSKSPSRLSVISGSITGFFWSSNPPRSPALPLLDVEGHPAERTIAVRRASQAPVVRARSPEVPPRLSLHPLRDAAPPSKAHENPSADCPLPTPLSAKNNKMHQTSSRLLRMTDDERPFTRVSRVHNS